MGLFSRLRRDGRRILTPFPLLTSRVYCLTPNQLHDLNEMNGLYDFSGRRKSFKSFKSCTLYDAKQKSVAVLEAPGILERRARQSGRIQDWSGGRLAPGKSVVQFLSCTLTRFFSQPTRATSSFGSRGPRSARPVLLRLAGFRKRGLARSAKIGALRQPHLRCLVRRTRSTRLPWSSRVGRESRGGRAGPSKVPPSPSGPSGQRPEADAF